MTGILILFGFHVYVDCPFLARFNCYHMGADPIERTRYGLIDAF